MAKSKKVGRPSVWPKGTQKPLNLGPVPKKLHDEIKAFTREKKASLLAEIEKEATNG